MSLALHELPHLIVHRDEPLARYTAARLGGPADILAIAQHRDALIAAVQWARETETRWIILGGGANVLISEYGFRGLVIINRSKETEIDAASGRVVADSGTNLTTLARRCIGQGLKGLEWGVSVPGTVGGAVVNNAGAHGGDMAHNLASVEIIDLETSTTPETWQTQALNYDYRYSVLKGKRGRYIVLQATLQLEPGHDPKELSQVADEFIVYRKRTQPPGASLGSMFKNPPDDYAGRLIEAAGLKGHRIGGVEVSTVHANFFTNTGDATASDYAALIQHVQQTVATRFGVGLELEIEQIGEGLEE
ncbi:MAG: UDP-N-acetylmuramate dehydrogenase [Chloroflexi bacterium]|nr:UDP-N-acetylmuramate dehydrogenase [Chloroflexota bacterium]